MGKIKTLSRSRFLTLVFTFCLSAVLLLSSLIVYALDNMPEGGGGTGPSSNATVIYQNTSYSLNDGKNSFEFTTGAARTYEFQISGTNKTVSKFIIYYNGTTYYSSTTNKTYYSFSLSSNTMYQIEIVMDLEYSGYATLVVSAY